MALYNMTDSRLLSQASLNVDLLGKKSLSQVITRSAFCWLSLSFIHGW